MVIDVSIPLRYGFNVQCRHGHCTMPKLVSIPLRYGFNNFKFTNGLKHDVSIPLRYGFNLHKENTASSRKAFQYLLGTVSIYNLPQNVQDERFNTS